MDVFLFGGNSVWPCETGIKKISLLEKMGKVKIFPIFYFFKNFFRKAVSMERPEAKRRIEDGSGVGVFTENCKSAFTVERKYSSL